MAPDDGDTTSGDTPTVSSIDGDSEKHPLPGVEHNDEATDGTGAPSGSDDVRYRRRSGWASRWVRGQVFARHRDGTEVAVTGSAAVTWMALAPPTPDGNPGAAPEATPPGRCAMAPADDEGATAIDLVARIERGWPEVGPVTITGVAEALATLVGNALVEPVPSTVTP